MTDLRSKKTRSQKNACAKRSEGVHAVLGGATERKTLLTARIYGSLILKPMN